MSQDSPKSWNGLEVQKIGIIGVLIFVIQLLFDQIKGDSKVIDDDISKLLVSQTVIEQRIELMSTEITRLSLLTEKRYKSSDAEKDIGIIQRQIDALTKELDKREEWMKEVEDHIRTHN